MIEHFKWVENAAISQWKRTYVWIVEASKKLPTVLEERERLNASESNHLLTRQGSVASGGRVEVRSVSRQIFKAKMNDGCDT